jgi:23S rRNA (guanosine2251-2'-O)-methyltransferase
MADQIITGFHAIEERIRRAAESNTIAGLSIKFSDPGPRVKKILAAAGKIAVPATEVDSDELDELVCLLPEAARDHRGIVLIIEGAEQIDDNAVDFDHWIASCRRQDADAPVTVIVLDSITDPHNVGAILRSCDQFGVSLVVMPERHSARGADNEVIARASAGSSAWVPVAVVSNLVRAVKMLKDCGFWVYGTDAGGSPLQQLLFPARTVIIMGSEGSGIARLLGEQCDTVVSIPTRGRIDSLNVSVAAGVVLYERYRQTLTDASGK